MFEMPPCSASIKRIETCAAGSDCGSFFATHDRADTGASRDDRSRSRLTTKS
jgi:hypothetical protein